MYGNCLIWLGISSYLPAAAPGPWTRRIPTENGCPMPRSLGLQTVGQRKESLAEINEVLARLCPPCTASCNSFAVFCNAYVIVVASSKAHSTMPSQSVEVGPHAFLCLQLHNCARLQCKSFGVSMKNVRAPMVETSNGPRLVASLILGAGAKRCRNASWLGTCHAAAQRGCLRLCTRGATLQDAGGRPHVVLALAIAPCLLCIATITDTFGCSTFCSSNELLQFKQ